MALLAGLSCAAVVSPAGAQTRTAVRASAHVLPASAAPDPASIPAWVREWRQSESGASDGVALVLPGRVAGQRRIESEIWTATLAEQCDPSRERRCGILVTVVFARN